MGSCSSLHIFSADISMIRLSSSLVTRFREDRPQFVGGKTDGGQQVVASRTEVTLIV